MSVTRRLFLKNSGIALASVGFAPLMGPVFLRQAAFGAQATAARRKKTLICLFQRGAADGLNIVIPHGDKDLYRHRPELAVPRPRSGVPTSALDLDGFFGLHPALAPLMPLYKAGHLAAIHACGSPDVTRSHFDAQDYMESGAPGDKRIADGWLSRTVLACPEDRAKLAAAKASGSPFRAVALGGDHGLPRSLQGEAGAIAIPDLKTFGIGVPSAAEMRRAGGKRRKAGGTGGDAAMMSAPSAGVVDGFETLYDGAVGDVLHGTGKESFEAMGMLKKAVPGAYVPANGAVYPAGRYGDSLKQIAQLVKADVGVEVAFAEMGGWDTHVNEGPRLTQQLREFGQGLAALYADLGDRMDDVVILTMSEFGRSVRANGNKGTDHGHATCFFALGGAVNGGKVLGKWPGLAEEQLYENRDLALTTDFRAVFGEIAVKHLGAQGLQRIFPGYQGSPADFRGVTRPA
jgi:uncharacterized protein (DUF1501 family)